MKLQVKRCRTCGALGIGPNAVKLRMFEGRWYCDDHWLEALSWHTNREAVISGIQSVVDFDQQVRQGLPKVKPVRVDWLPLIREWSGLAGWALEVGDRRTFVHYFSRAMQAWGLSEELQ